MDEVGWPRQYKAVWDENVQPFVAKLCNMKISEQQHALDESIANLLEWRVVPEENRKKTVRIGLKSAQLLPAGLTLWKTVIICNGQIVPRLLRW